MDSSDKCPYAESGHCQIATRLANVPVKLNPDACRTCQVDTVPMSINRVTSAIAAHAQHAAKKPVDINLLRIATGRFKLAGYVLERYIHRWLKSLKIPPPLNCGCDEWIRKMNEWGIKGSLEHLDEICDHLLVNLQTTYLAGIAIPFVTKPILMRMVRRCLLRELS